MNAWRPLLISTEWYRAGQLNKLTPLASIELSWQQKKESNLTTRLCSNCLWLTTVSYLLQCMKWFRIRLPFWLCRICSLQSFLNAIHKLICFAGLWPCSALFVFKIHHWWPLRVLPEKNLSEPFLYFTLYICLVFFPFTACKCTLQTKYSLQLNVKGSNT